MDSTTQQSTHICLVSSQPTPNLVAACDPEHKPSKVILVFDPPMRQRAEWLSQVFAGRQIESEMWTISNPYDYAHIRLRLEELLARQDLGSLKLNATGGTKVMSLAAHGLFRERQLPIFYVQPDKDLLIPLFPEESPKEIPDRLKLPEFLQAHGYQVTGLRRETISSGRQQLGRTLLENLTSFEKALGPLNYLAGTAEGRPSLESDTITIQHLATKGFEDLVALFSQENLLIQEHGRLRFASEAERFFVNGGWLEEYLFARVGRLRNRLKIQDAAMSVSIQSPGGTPNEIDMAILHNNRLHLIECKTRQMANGNGAGTGALYKIDSLRDLGGHTSRALIASYRKLANYDQRRARDLGVALVCAKDLLSVEEIMENWLTT